MKICKKSLFVVLAIVIVGAFVCINGCDKKDSGTVRVAKAGSVDLCIKCGQIKGTDSCCKPDQAKCTGCGLAKGSPGCCNIPKDATAAALCTKCGQLKGSDSCCKPGAVKCDKCGLAKGSPGCCKLPK
ncbi:MAG: hypothetical protein FVQ82_00995 [Planctomycetes bacterium]|nr:hypothetical protein [Planctomycetota bacterium]